MPEAAGGETAANRQRDAGRSRDTILDAAERLFAEKGYEGTSLKEIGEAAGLSRGTPAYFFGSKQGLYAAVKERLAEYVKEFAGQASSANDPTSHSGKYDSPRDVISNAARAYVDFLASRPTYVRFIEREAAGEDAFLVGGSSGETTNLAGSLAEFGSQFLRRELERGGRPFGEEEIRRLSASMTAVCCFPFLLGGGLFRTFGLEPADPGFTEEHKEHATRFIMGGLYG